MIIVIEKVKLRCIQRQKENGKKRRVIKTTEMFKVEKKKLTFDAGLMSVIGET